MTKKVWGLVFRGHEVERRRMVLEGSSLWDSRRNERYAVKARPVLLRRNGRGAGDVYLCSGETAATFGPARGATSATIDGREYQITPEFLAELLDSRDLAALNQASRPVSWLLILLAAGTGAALGFILPAAIRAAGGSI